MQRSGRQGPDDRVQPALCALVAPGWHGRLQRVSTWSSGRCAHDAHRGRSGEREQACLRTGRAPEPCRGGRHGLAGLVGWFRCFPRFELSSPTSCCTSVHCRKLVTCNLQPVPFSGSGQWAAWHEHLRRDGIRKACYGHTPARSGHCGHRIGRAAKFPCCLRRPHRPDWDLALPATCHPFLWAGSAAAGSSLRYRYSGSMIWRAGLCDTSAHR